MLKKKFICFAMVGIMGLSVVGCSTTKPIKETGKPTEVSTESVTEAVSESFTTAETSTEGGTDEVIMEIQTEALTEETRETESEEFVEPASEEVIIEEEVETEEGTESIEAITEPTEALTEAVETETESTIMDEDDGLHILVAYYSATGATQGVAETIADYLDADLYTIMPEEAYTDEDLDFSSKDSRVSKEKEEKDFEVKLIEPEIEDFDKYDIVYLGYPIWFGNASWVVDGFVKANDFSDKVVIPFCTSDETDIEGSYDELEKMAGGIWLEGKRFDGTEEESEIVDWAFYAMQDFLYGDVEEVTEGSIENVLEFVLETETE